jgi:hypothetical protein
MSGLSRHVTLSVMSVNQYRFSQLKHNFPSRTQAAVQEHHPFSLHAASRRRVKTGLRCGGKASGEPYKKHPFLGASGHDPSSNIKSII